MNGLNKIWEFGSKEPIQRIGILFLTVGIISLLSWVYKENLDLNQILNPEYFPQKRDGFFFHLFLYFLPIGFLLSWGYFLLLKIKRWVFYKKPSGEKLIFKDNLSAFSFATTIHKPLFEKNQMSFGIIQEVIHNNNSIQGFLVQLANSEGTTLVAGINDKYQNSLGKNDLVYWVFVSPSKEHFKFEASGYILALLEPEYDVDKKEWLIAKDLTK
ncbi:hypothetical protein K5D25_04495 [Acinetobacter baumannii]|uniref:hypothetical protein n=1 Tax=Acinetobacter baumannii TaxID=470 RepID=UPI000F7DA38B|nr:hypothetical protein [Acinetobacter baumannii]MCJ8813043.1 hypothetical protein [Acinetobacter baumannii]MCJ8835517.1 hypothetical protein [Acinetobacter baumannii]MUQ88997.1 hypothetical protein [Acinetobacter baumannii]RSZ98818.1 hypothetical protein EJ478_03055 [Acinetobacter baumannii]BDT81328.1 hypothetical protein VNAB260_11790 [Acinetobacter baumannii]